MIVTFYSYKGGVGRSMALANAADLLCRSGLRVLMVDFDLEAPGLENFFPISGEVIRDREGLLDLLLAFKYSMSVASSADDEQDTFRDLGRFTTTVYPERSDGGALDLITAGQRATDEQALRYGVELRRFDWTEFYFTWSGELFFEWLRRAFAERYDVVLIDSRTGVTEMGGICAYQLADAIVLLCGPNMQNLDGTGTMVRHFLSPDVRKIRGDRSVDVLIVPARVDQGDPELLRAFQQRFSERFASYVPSAMTAVDLTFWDLQIPYEPRYAFDEQVVTDPGRTQERRGLAAAYGNLVKGIAALAPADTPLAGLSPSTALTAQEPVETRYDPTTRFAGPDVYVSCTQGSGNFSRLVMSILQGAGFAPFMAGGATARSAADPLSTAKTGLFLLGREPFWPMQLAEVVELIARGRPVIPVLLPGSDPSLMPVQLREVAYLDFRSGIDENQLVVSVGTALSPMRSGASGLSAEQVPYPGLMPFAEQDARLLFGRTQLVDEMVAKLAADGGCALVGPAGSGKTSAVLAGLIPALRQDVIPGSDAWPIVSLGPSGDPYQELIRSLTRLLPTPADDDIEPERLGLLLLERFSRVVLVVDDLDSLFELAGDVECERFGAAIERLNEQGIVAPVLVLRPEFLEEAARAPSLDRWVTSSRVSVSPLRPAELRMVIEEPARAAGLVFEPGLVDRLLGDLPEGAVALRILQKALRQLWDGQRDGYITHRSYAALGGLKAVLVAQVEEAVVSLPADDQQIVRTLLLRLVMVTDGSPHRRDAVELDELTTPLETLGVSRGAARQVILLLANSSALAMSEDVPVRVALAHEALISDWHRLARWVEEDLAALAARSQLDRAAEEWQRRDRDESVLLTSERVDQLLVAIASMPLSRLERAYVDAVAARGRRIDFFLSYAGGDRAWAEWIAWQLAEAGYGVELDVWDWTPGQNFVTAMSDALARADRIMLILSGESIRTSQFRELPVTARDLLPVRVGPVTDEQLSPALRALTSVDLFDLPEEDARQALLSAVATSSRRPDRARSFPTGATSRSLPRLGPRLPGSLPQVWSVPARNPGFAGRDDLLETMRDTLTARRRAAVMVLVGLSGVGRTQLAVEYSYRFAGGYDLVWWIDAERPELIAQQFAALAAQLVGEQHAMNVEFMARAALNELRTRDRWLLVFDDAQGPGDVLPWLPSGEGHVVITSRTPGWSDVASVISVPVMARAESAEFLREKVPGLTAAEADELAAALGDLPLALAQAAGYMTATAMPAREYLYLLSTRTPEILDQGTPAFYRRSLAAITKIDFQQLRAEDPVAGQVVMVCACLGPEPIPVAWFTRAPWLQPSAADPVAWRTVLARIGSRGIAAVDQDVLRMHRLTQAILRDDLSREDADTARTRAAELLITNDPGDPSEPPDWPAWAQLLPHLLAMEPAAAHNPELRDLAPRAASYLLARGDTENGRDLAERLYERWREELGPNHRSALQAATTLAAALRAVGRYEASRRLSQDTLDRSREVLGADHPGTLAAAQSLATDLRLTGEVRRARDLDDEVLAQSLRLLGADHPGTLAAAQSLATDLRLTGEVRLARDLDDEVLAQSRRLLGADHPGTLAAARGLSASLRLLGEVQAARQLDEDTLDRSRRVLGNDHPDTLRAARQLATDLGMLGDGETARELNQDTLDRSRRVLGEHHPETLEAADALAANLEALGDSRAARELREGTRRRL